MIDIELGVEDFGRVRFLADPLWSATASLAIFVCASANSVHAPLVELTRRRGLQEVEFLRELTHELYWFPSLLAPSGCEECTDGDVAGHLRSRLTKVSLDDVARDLDHIRKVRPGSAIGGMTPRQLRSRTADALAVYWQMVLQPLWAKAMGLAEADIAYRAEVMAKRGLTSTLSDLSNRITFDGSVLHLDNSIDTRLATGRGLWLVPSVFRASGYTVREVVDPSDPHDAPIVSYPARGAARLWERGPSGGGPLQRLLGRTRTRVLTASGLPSTTTELAGLLGLPKATVSGHLRTLTDAGLMIATRRAKEVYYDRTALGDELLQLR
ncbi:ArsR/SmtB family transcription factor [Calidifontibacter indicus]|uniref:ArsR/SmtB family transcription factor n=1 Tax=Calidifontibacter indicus TaxID=419650 RepID=UPI003D75E324